MTSIITTGCSSAPTVIEFDQDKLDITGEKPLDRCEWPELFESVADDGSPVIYMTAKGLKQQRACQITEQTNHTVAQNNAESVDDAVAAFNALIDKAQLHNEYAQNELDREHDDTQAAKTEAWTVKGLLAAVLIAVAL